MTLDAVPIGVAAGPVPPLAVTERQAVAKPQTSAVPGERPCRPPHAVERSALVAPQLGDNVGQRFVIENRPGAGGTIAMKSVLDWPAEGYVLGEMGNGQSIASTLFTKLPYDILKDFSPVSVAGSFPVLIAVSGASPYHSLKDVVEAAKKSPGKLNLGAIHPGITQNLS